MALPATLAQIESALTQLECPECGRHFEADRLQTICEDCRSPLLARYDLDKARQTLTPQAAAARPRGLWRWAELLPVRKEKNRLTLGEGDTPLLPAPRLGLDPSAALRPPDGDKQAHLCLRHWRRQGGSGQALNLPHLYIKDESPNPTGSFKARGLAVAVARGEELRVKGYVIPTAGNAGGALAAYAARAKAQAHVFMPKDAPIANQAEVRAFGADLVLVEGLISDAGKMAAEQAKEHRWFDVSTFKEPYRLEGKKTMGLELAEQFGWDLPDVILYPTGGGTGLVGMWKAFAELEAMGWIGAKRPRMVSVQAAGCAPIVRAFQQNAERAEFWQGAETLAAGLRVPGPFADRLILRAIRESHGTALAVADEEISAAQKEMAEAEGIFAAPEGAATLAALKHLVRQGWVKPEDRVVLFNTGSGLKYL